MSELINIGMPVADSLLGTDLPKPGEAANGPADDFSNLLYGLAGTPVDGQTFRQSGRHLLGGAGTAAPENLLATKSADAVTTDDNSAAPAPPERRMSELEFLFHRHAGKPFVMLDTQSTQQVTPALQPVATAENPRLANVLAMLLPDGEHAQLASSSTAPAEDLPTMPLPWLRPAVPAPAQTLARSTRGSAEALATAGNKRPPTESIRSAAPTPERQASGGDPRAAAASAGEAVARDSARIAEAVPAMRAFSDAAPIRADGNRPPAAQKGLPGPGVFSTSLASTSLLSPQAISAPPAPGGAVPVATATAQVAEQLVWMAQTGQNSAQVRLHPEELGMVNIRITLESGSARIAIEASHPDMVQELTSSAPRLRNLLAHEGLGLNALEIEQRPNTQFSGQSGGQQAGQQSDDRSRLAGGSADDWTDAQTEADLLDDPLAAGAMRTTQSTVRLLDLFA